MHEIFDTPGHTTVRIRIPSGQISLEASGTGRTEVEVEPLEGSALPRVEARAVAGGWIVTVESDEGRRFFRRHSYRVRVLCPEGSAVEVKTASAGFDGRGGLASLEAATASGDIRVERVDGPCTVHTASGDVEVRAGLGPVEVRTVSGDAVVDRADGSVRFTTASGGLRIGRAGTSVQAHSVSGDQSIEAVRTGSVWLETVSGDLEVGVLPGVDVWMDLQSLSGETTSSLASADAPASDAGPGLELRMKSVSGDLRVRPSSDRVSSAP